MSWRSDTPQASHGLEEGFSRVRKPKLLGGEPKMLRKARLEMEWMKAKKKICLF